MHNKVNTEDVSDIDLNVIIIIVIVQGENKVQSYFVGCAQKSNPTSHKR